MPVGDGRREHRLRADPADLVVPGGGDRRAVRRGPHTPPRDAARGLDAALAGPVHGPRRGLRGDQAGPRLLRRPLRPSVPVRQVRPDLRARVQLRGDGERGRGDVQRALRLPRPSHGHAAPDAGRDGAPRAGPHVVRRPRDDALVGRPLAQRELRDLRLQPRARRGHPVRRGVAGLPRRHEAVGLPGRRALHHPPRLGGRPGHGCHLLQLRWDHLRKGRLGHQAARGRDRPRGVPGRPPDLLPPPCVGQRHPCRLPGGPRGGRRASPARLEPPVAGDGVAQHDRGRMDDARWPGRTAPADPGRAGRPPDASPACPRAGPRAGRGRRPG